MVFSRRYGFVVPTRRNVQRYPNDEELSVKVALEVLNMKLMVSEADYPMLCESTRRQRGELALTMLMRYVTSLLYYASFIEFYSILVLFGSGKSLSVTLFIAALCQKVVFDLTCKAIRNILLNNFSRYKDSLENLAVVLDGLLDPRMHRMYKLVLKTISPVFNF